MKKNHVFTYLFVLCFCFIAMGSKVLAKDTVCVYDVSPAKFDYTGHREEMGTVRLKVTISDDKFNVEDNYTKDSVTKFSSLLLDKKAFVNSDKKTSCPNRLSVIGFGIVEGYAENVSMYGTRFFITTGGSISDADAEKIKEYGESEGKDIDFDKELPPFVATNVSSENKNVGEQTNIEGGIADNLSTTRPTTGIKVVGCSIFGDKTLPIVKTAFRLIRLGIPILIVIMGTIDFLGVVFSGEEKNFKEAGQKFVKRVAAGIIFVFIPYFLTFLINISGVMEDYDLKTDELFCVFGGADQIVTENDTAEENKTEQNNTPNNVTTQGNDNTSSSSHESSSGRENGGSSGGF